MSNKQPKAIGEYGYTQKTYECVICGAKISMSGYFLRDFEGYPLIKDGTRRDFLFPDGTSKQGLVCDICGDKKKNGEKLTKHNNKWSWSE